MRDEAALGDRIEFVEGSFFDSVPEGDAYVLSGILHDWPDEDAARILRTIRAAAPAARAAADQRVRDPARATTPDGAKWLDLLMLVLAGGRERDEEQWRALLEGAGWEAVRFARAGPICRDMPLTVGTAGHIDHGKTALVEALTGKNTDRLPEEHERGISIDLGYAPLELPDGTSLSVVDVPGHERFVRTMVAGASGIDLFLLVIDAGEGARPQTHEHLAILRLLGIEHGVVALTKADVVDEETLELARVEAEELVPGAPVVATSARTGAGLDELRAALAEVAARVGTPRRRRAGPPPRRPLLHAARDRDGRDRDALVGDDRRGRRAAASSRAAAPCGCGACRCTTGRSSAPRRGSASRSLSPASSGRSCGAATSSSRRDRSGRASGST